MIILFALGLMDAGVIPPPPPDEEVIVIPPVDNRDSGDGFTEKEILESYRSLIRDEEEMIVILKAISQCLWSASIK